MNCISIPILQNKVAILFYLLKIEEKADRDDRTYYKKHLRSSTWFNKSSFIDYTKF